MNWSDLWNNYINLKPGIVEILLRLGCAMLVGTLIGIEREYTHRPAGLRTHILVALGACVISIAGEILFYHYSALGAAPDPSRLSAQAISGIGFLGAGTIMKEGATVKGLTTAASLWAVACLGIAAGFGHYALALMGMVFIMVTLTVFEMLQQRFIHVGSNDSLYILETTNLSASLNRVSQAAQANTATVLDMAAKQNGDSYTLTFRVWFSGRRNRRHHQQFFDTIAAAPETREFRPAETQSANPV